MSNMFEAEDSTKTVFNGSWHLNQSVNFEKFVESVYEDKPADFPRKMTKPAPFLQFSVNQSFEKDEVTVKGPKNQRTFTVGEPQWDVWHWLPEERVSFWENGKLLLQGVNGKGRWSTVVSVEEAGKTLHIAYTSASGVAADLYYSLSQKNASQIKDLRLNNA